MIDSFLNVFRINEEILQIKEMELLKHDRENTIFYSLGRFLFGS
jgi:hypothetical protein